MVDPIHILWIDDITNICTILHGWILCNWITIVHHDQCMAMGIRVYVYVDYYTGWMGIVIDIIIILLSSVYKQGQNINNSGVSIVSMDIHCGIDN